MAAGVKSGISGAGSGRTPVPIALRRLRGGNAGKLGLSNAVNPPLMVDGIANEWKSRLLGNDALAQDLWDLYVEEGRQAKLLASMDAPMLAAMCIELASYLRAAQEIGQAVRAKEWSRLVHEKSGAYKGVMAVNNKAFEHAMALVSQFGGMPAARAKMAAINTQMDLFHELEKQPVDPHERAQRLIQTLGELERMEK